MTMMETKIDEKDLEIDFYRRRPLVNEDPTACRIVHRPTGTEVRSQEEGSKHHNKRRALRLLEQKLDGDR